MIHDSFTGLGTSIEGTIDASEVRGRALWATIRREVAIFEHRFSRFDRRSEVYRLNVQHGKPMVVSPEFIALLQASHAIFTLTDGIVDPTVGQALVAVGYDASFDTLQDRPEGDESHAMPTPTNFSKVTIDSETRTVQLPAGTSLDFGGVGKGYLLDQLRPVIEKITKNFCLSFGGDLLVSGVNEKNQPWTIDVQNPAVLHEQIGVLRMPAGRWGLATSGITKRRGVRRGRTWHHIIDPRTRQPSDTDVLSATVLAPTALEADIAAKSIIIRGSEDGCAWLHSLPHSEALVVGIDSTIKITSPVIEYIPKGTKK